MWDGWEAAYGCLGCVVARLPGFRRIFNKGSVRNWGTKAQPGPTLNLIPADGHVCHGIAFEFAQDVNERVMSELRRREGGFEFRAVDVLLPDARSVQARVPIYRGRNLITAKQISEIADMARAACGTSGACADYVRNIAQKINDLGVQDADVRALLAALDGGERA